jgi:hypothetical protein
MPGWALVWLLALTLVGSVIFGCGYLGGAIAPTEKDAYDSFEEDGQPPPYYPGFSALAYSFERAFPLVDLGVKNHWGPKLGTAGTLPRTPLLSLRWLGNVQVRGHFPFRLSETGFLRYWLWLQILVGWVLATLFVAGLTGVVKPAP